MQSVQQTYVFNQTAGAVTETVNGNWLQAYCEFLGVTQPVNSSWLQALCIHFGITAPLYGSWTIALANYYGITQPLNGTWWYALSQAQPPITELIWNTTTSFWNLTDKEWLIASAPSDPTFDQEGELLTSPTPTFTGTADANNAILLVVDGTTYNGVADGLGVWSIPITTPLPGATGAGQNYPVNITANDLTTGLETSIVGSVNILQTTKTIRFELDSDWSLEWYYTGIQVEKEVTPGSWTAIEYEGQPTWVKSGVTTPYKVLPWINGEAPAGYDTVNVMSFQDGDNQLPAPIPREIVLNQGFNYRIVGVSGTTDPTNYGRFSKYTVYDGATILLAEYDGEDADYITGAVQQTFTL